jgi:hypothetical protein
MENIHKIFYFLEELISIIEQQEQLDEIVNSKDILNEIKRFCRKKLESFKVPVKIIITHEPFYSGRFKKQRTN